MSLTEEARTPFSLVDEINQVRVSFESIFDSQLMIVHLRVWMPELSVLCTTRW